MIVQVKDDRNNRFRAVLKGTNAWIDFDVNGISRAAHTR